MAKILSKNSRSGQRSKSGQAIVEYLLLLAVIVGIVGGVLRIAAYSWLAKTKASIIQGGMGGRLNQSLPGIPLHWFFAGRDVGEVNQAFKKADEQNPGNTGGGGENAGDDGENAGKDGDLSDKDKLNPDGSDSDKPNGGGGDNGGGGGDGPGGARPSRTNAPQVSKTPSAKAGDPNADANRGKQPGLQGKRNVEGDDDDPGGNKKKRKGSGVSEMDSGYDAETGKATADLNDDGKIDEKDDEIAAEKAEEEKALSPEARAKRRVLEAQQARSSGGCRKLSTFELIRMGIFIMVGFIGFIVLFASRGKGGND